ncbi:hypothetical protein NE237_007602 [Protea cynaroides]|uniref:Uncharacterized protein n=1 Tax=Protea cynaroides TaxID=273540 RepID=A0A9Q0QWD2_9MAGN|nr:hypothetical protein NE237_007602 [Protea cynaroides]
MLPPCKYLADLKASMLTYKQMEGARFITLEGCSSVVVSTSLVNGFLTFRIQGATQSTVSAGQVSMSTEASLLPSGGVVTYGLVRMPLGAFMPTSTSTNAWSLSHSPNLNIIQPPFIASMQAHGVSDMPSPPYLPSHMLQTFLCHLTGNDH